LEKGTQRKTSVRIFFLRGRDLNLEPPSAKQDKKFGDFLVIFKFNRLFYFVTRSEKRVSVA
jgi:hypothetical protein